MTSKQFAALPASKKRKAVTRSFHCHRDLSQQLWYEMMAGLGDLTADH